MTMLDNPRHEVANIFICLLRRTRHWTCHFWYHDVINVMINDALGWWVIIKCLQDNHEQWPKLKYQHEGTHLCEKLSRLQAIRHYLQSHVDSWAAHRKMVEKPPWSSKVAENQVPTGQITSSPYIRGRCLETWWIFEFFSPEVYVDVVREGLSKWWTALVKI